ncbi:MAG TPA: phospholipid carrier-dependent glycosyltransferase [Actinomadura sp.]|jgi:dolichyl-phosphate-mannose--protein O-mannosyl transferase|nr:phospholipid carrier-dependent glycosyltransferase [Actinomadura sp.]
MATTEIEPTTTTVQRRRPPTMREWLTPAIPGHPLLGWIGPLLVTAFAAFLRFDRLANPTAVVFDETYYAKDALALLKYGYEHNTVKGADGILIHEGAQAGNRIWADGASFVAHPPAGKWMIALGEWIFGATPFGWRFMAALVGSLSVLILCRVGRRMTGSTLLGCAGGLLLAVDGLHLVTSRTALLDIFVMFWILAGFACLVADRDRSRATLVAKLRPYDDGAGLGPFVFHGWRILAGLCLGLACATKWTGVFYLAAFGIMAVVWDLGARRAARVPRPYAGTLLLDAVPAFLSLVVVAVITYVASWWGWIFNSGGWGRGKIADNVLMRPFEAMPDLWRYHTGVWNFHTTLHAKHPYQSWPWDWPILHRPVAFFYTESKSGCGAAKCSREILGIGTPVIWWGALVALLLLVVVWLRRRDWRAGAILVGYLAGWVPWFYYAVDKRTMFLFYATPMLPFMVLAIVLCLGMLIGPARDTGPRRALGTAAAGAYVLVALANFLWFYPVLTAKVIPYDTWREIVRFHSWI